MGAGAIRGRDHYRCGDSPQTQDGSNRHIDLLISGDVNKDRALRRVPDRGRFELEINEFILIKWIVSLVP